MSKFAQFTLDPVPLGMGQSASVYRATDDANQAESSLKVFNQETIQDKVLLKRFECEVKVLKKLRHPGIVEILDSGIHEGQPWISMTYCKSMSLTDNEDLKQASVGRKMRGLAQIAAALDFIHANEVIHRDLKPSNILIDEKGNFLLTDFGIAKSAADLTNITTTGSVLGTAAYMSPEQAQAQDLKIGPPRYACPVTCLMTRGTCG